jgi:integrase
MGTLFKKRGSKQWQMGVSIGGRQVCKSAHTTNKGIAKKLLARWETEVFEGRYQLIRTKAPTFEEWAEEFLPRISYPKTRSRYASSVNNLKPKFARLRLSQITPDLIEDFKDERLADSAGPATINRDLAVLRRMLKLAQRKRFIAQSPFSEVDFLEERSVRRKPHIVTFDEEKRILDVADPHIRVLAVLILETGLRSNREALVLKWADIDFVSDIIRVLESKTAAGIRNVPLSARCKSELLRWRSLVGPRFSPHVFPNMRNPERSLKQIRGSWAKALKLANVNHFWIYNLRHTFASRLSAAGLPDLFVAQMMGHSTPSILQTYAKLIDEYRRNAIRKLEDLRKEHEGSHLPPVTVRPASVN